VDEQKLGFIQRIVDENFFRRTHDTRTTIPTRESGRKDRQEDSSHGVELVDIVLATGHSFSFHVFPFSFFSLCMTPFCNRYQHKTALQLAKIAVAFYHVIIIIWKQ
jgi:hypothetical protein